MITIEGTATVYIYHCVFFEVRTLAIRATDGVFIPQNSYFTNSFASILEISTRAFVYFNTFKNISTSDPEFSIISHSSDLEIQMVSNGFINIKSGHIFHLYLNGDTNH